MCNRERNGNFGRVRIRRHTTGCRTYPPVRQPHGYNAHWRHHTQRSRCRLTGIDIHHPCLLSHRRSTAGHWIGWGERLREGGREGTRANALASGPVTQMGRDQTGLRYATATPASPVLDPCHSSLYRRGTLPTSKNDLHNFRNCHMSVANWHNLFQHE